MFELSRTVRFFINDDVDTSSKRRNGHSAWPPPHGLGRYFELNVSCQGEPNATSGYFLNIHQIDTAVRSQAIPILHESVSGPGPSGLGVIMQTILARLQPPLHDSVSSARLNISPHHSVTIRSQRMHHVLIRQEFEFAAAHRLNVEAWSEEENRRYFGKCNNPSGHGHNYRVEVAVEAPIDAEGHVRRVEDLDDLVEREVITCFDHKNLNVDVPQFETLNPSVEHIAMVVYGMLEEPIKTLGVNLHEIRVWETERTVCTYRGKAKREA